MLTKYFLKDQKDSERLELEIAGMEDTDISALLYHRHHFDQDVIF